MVSEHVTSDQVRQWLVAVEADLQRVDSKMRPLLEEQARLEEREELLRSLLASFQSGSARNGAGGGPATSPSGSVREYVVGRAVEILRDAGSPMHINDLHAKFLERGFTIPGAGTPANLIVHIRSSDEIASPQRGVYGLTAEVGPTRVRRRAKKRVSGRRRKG